MFEDSGFSVIEEQEIGDLSQVAESAPVMPPTSNVRLKIKKVQVKESKENKEEERPAGQYKWLSLGLQLVDGLGEEGKWKNAYVWSENLCYYANPEYYPKSVNEQKSLFFGGFGSLQRATGIKTTKMNDQFVADIQDKIILGNILQSKGQDGELRNVVKGFKAVPADSEV